MDYTGWPPRPVNGAAMFKADLPVGAVERLDRKKAREKRLLDAYKAAEARDHMRCRVTSKPLKKSAVSDVERLEHHHLVKRSRSKGLREKASNIVCVSALAHRLIERGWLACEGTNANRPLFWFWTKLAKSKPLIIKRWNRAGTE